MNQVIKVLNKEHGRKVIQYWKDRGVDTRNYRGNAITDYMYYGVINNKFNNFNAHQVRMHNAEIITLPEEFTLPTNWKVRVTPESIEELGKWRINGMLSQGAIHGWVTSEDKGIYYNCTNPKADKFEEITYEQFLKYVLNKPIMKENKLTRKQLVEAYNRFDCPDWKTAIRNILSENVLATDDKTILIPSVAIKLLLSKGTLEQISYAKGLGITIREDKNAFVNEFPKNRLEGLSYELFGNTFTLQILTMGAPEDRPDLNGRAFFLSPECDVRVGESRGGGTYIEIIKK